jgi:hypothetical protein
MSAGKVDVNSCRARASAAAHHELPVDKLVKYALRGMRATRSFRPQWRCKAVSGGQPYNCSSAWHTRLQRGLLCMQGVCAEISVKLCKLNARIEDRVRCQRQSGLCCVRSLSGQAERVDDDVRVR